MENVAQTIQNMELDLVEALLSGQTTEVMTCVVTLNDFLKEKGIVPTEDTKFLLKGGIQHLTDHGKINSPEKEAQV